MNKYKVFIFLLLTPFKLLASGSIFYDMSTQLEHKNRHLFPSSGSYQQSYQDSLKSVLERGQLLWGEPNLKQIFLTVSARKCYLKIPSGNSMLLSQAIATAPAGCILEIEGLYNVSQHLELNVVLQATSNHSNVEATHHGPFQFTTLKAVSTASQDSESLLAVLSAESERWPQSPGAVLIPSQEVGDQWLTVHSQGKLVNVGIEPSSVDASFGCTLTGINMTSSYKGIQAGIPEHSIGKVCHQEHLVTPGLSGNSVPIRKVPNNGNGSAPKDEPPKTEDKKNAGNSGGRKSGASAVSTGGSAGKRDDDDEDDSDKTWAWMIAKLLEGKTGGMTVQEIYEGLKNSSKVVAYMRRHESNPEATSLWQAMVRNNLMAQRFFTKARSMEGGGRKGKKAHHWCVDSDWKENYDSGTGRRKKVRHSSHNYREEGGRVLQAVPPSACYVPPPNAGMGCCWSGASYSSPSPSLYLYPYSYLYPSPSPSPFGLPACNALMWGVNLVDDGSQSSDTSRTSDVLRPPPSDAGPDKGGGLQ